MRTSGAFGRENVGMSNHYPNEKLGPRKSKVSVALAINHGLGGTKAMAKAAADVQLVNIPALPCDYPWCAKEINLRALLVWHGLREVHASADFRFSFYWTNASEAPSEKSIIVTSYGIRTGNRHRWIGRVAQGERVICRQGTRQKSGRNFGIRPTSRRFSPFSIMTGCTLCM